MDQSYNIDLLNEDRFLKENLLSEIRVSKEEMASSLRILRDVFGKVPLSMTGIPKREESHPFARSILSVEAMTLQEIKTFAQELKVCDSMDNRAGVFERLRNANEYFGARAEIKAGAWVRSALRSAKFIPPSKNEKTADIFSETKYGPIVIEIKTAHQFDLETGFSMFASWVRSSLVEHLFKKLDAKVVIKFGPYWVDAIGASCAIDGNMTNASWVFHSVIMSLTNLAFSKIYAQRDSLQGGSHFQIKPDIDLSIDQDHSPVLEIILPPSDATGALGKILRGVSSIKNQEQIKNKEGAFFFSIRKHLDEELARTMIGNFLLHASDIVESCLGVVIVDDETNNILIIHNTSPSAHSSEEEQRRWKKLNESFKNPENVH